MRLHHVLLTISVFISLIIHAQDKRAMTPLDIAKLELVNFAALSDDGKYVAYTVRVQADPLKENKPARNELYLYDVMADRSLPFVTRGNVGGVSFRPAYHTLTFLNRLDGSTVTGLYEIGLHGGEATLLYTFETSIVSYEWSPDGKTLAFIAPMPKKSEQPKPVYTPELYEQNLTLNRAYFVKPGEGDAKELQFEGHFTALKWNPTGDRLVYAVSPTSLVDDTYMAQHLYIVNYPGMGIEGTVNHDGKLGDFVWNPDGSQLAFIAGTDINDPIDGQLFVVPAKGGTPKMLEGEWKGMFEQIEWVEPNYINVMGSQGVDAVYGKVSPNPSRYPTQIKVIDTLALVQIDVTPGGNAITVAEKWNHPPELYSLSASTGKWKRITKSNAWLDEIAFAKQEVVKYKAKDGLEIEGILIRPLNEESGKKYPLITVVHGGPEAHYNNGWLTGYGTPGQVAAGQDYAVFYPNYRGSTGRGHAFTLTSQGDAAGLEFDDIVDGVDYLVSRGFVDKDKVGVTGGSYGGYATGWMATRYTERFAAGVMFVGISDKVSKWGTTDIPNEEYLVHARKWVYEDYDFFLKRSPIYYAGQCKTPLMIVHGKEDTRVHPSQSMELYRHIKSRTSTPVELVLYPGEGHGNANSASRYDFNVRMMGWFDRH
ncbi:MAG TPA: S9 family peptidase, partial [Saprospiraceae bacterium]|nr:S9 family peptidase [Saprospiraceae bacterium]